MTTEYRVSLDRNACDGIFACLVRDERFVEASDGLATVDGGDDGNSDGNGDGRGDGADENTDGSVIATFADDRVDDARQAARACPVGAIEVTETGTDAPAGSADGGGRP